MSSKPRSALLVRLAAGGSRSALFLATVATLGFIIAPLLHAEAHVREEEDEEAGTAPEHHSHAPAPEGSHGAGALEHLSVALHAAPRLPAVISEPPRHAPPMPLQAQRRGTLRYLVPQWSQGPPRAH